MVCFFAAPASADRTDRTLHRRCARGYSPERPVFQRFGVFALAIFHHRRQQHQAFAFRLAQHVVDHLADGLRRQRHMVIRAARLADAGEQQAQVVVDLGDGADRGSRVVRGGFLLDGDRRRQTFNMVDVRLFHQRQELARIGGERFDVAALPFGIQRIESQR